MASVELKNIYKVFHTDGVDNTVVHDFTLKIEDGEFVVLVGPSGCGKSTTLRMIAGLEEITGGELYIGDRLVNNVPPKNRDIAMVFQNYALYPHMNVYKNMAFGLQLRRMPKDVIQQKVEDAAKILDIKHLLNRKPKQLSGGQRQRVALGRAMVRDPAVFLLDEPLSNLDAKLRTTMRAEISQLHRRLRATFVYVTHDQTEAMTMGDRIVVMKDGFIQQIDTPQNLYDHPVNLFVAGFIGSPQMNFLPVSIQKTDGGCAANFNGQLIDIPHEKAGVDVLSAYIGKDVVVGIRPEDLHYGDTVEGKGPACTIRADVDLSEMLGSEKLVYASCGDTKLISKAPAKSHAEPGDVIEFTVDCLAMHLFDVESGAAL